jgi:hypothetical protein
MIALLAVSVLFAADPPPRWVGMAVTSRGAVALQRGKEKRRLGAGDYLKPGDRLQAGPGGEAVLVFFHDGHSARLKPGREVVLTTTGCSPPDAVVRVAPAKKLTKALLSRLSEIGPSDRAGVVVGRGGPPPSRRVVTPMFGSTVLTTRPSLSWQPTPGARSYRVELRTGEEGRTLLWRATTAKPALKYPARQKPLEYSADYSWRVTALLPGGKEKRVVQSEFMVITEADVEEVAQVKALTRGDDPAGWLLAAVLYEQHGAYNEALPLYERLARQAPAEVNFHKALAVYYELAGRADLARKARERAEKLGAVFPKK